MSLNFWVNLKNKRKKFFKFWIFCFFYSVAQGYASVHFTAERSKYYPQLKAAEDAAKEKRLKIWKDYVEPVATEDEPAAENHQTSEAGGVPERTPKYKKVVVTEVLENLHFYVQLVDEGKEKSFGVSNFLMSLGGKRFCFILFLLFRKEKSFGAWNFLMI